MRLIIAFYLLIAVLTSVAQENVVGTTYHNVTAHYNAYWLAKERIIEVEKSIKDRYQWDFNKMLPVFPQFDTTASKSLEQPLSDCIEKASIAIQRHPGSRWEYDAYNLVGLARLYGSEFPEGIETFKYVNTRAELIDDRNNALIGLMRTFIEANEMDNALAVSDYLKKNKLSDDALKNLSLTRGYYYQKSGQIEEMANSMATAEKLMNGDPEHARIAFTLGQAYQAIGNDSAAYISYRKALKESKTYELSFYSKLNMSQVAQAYSKASSRAVRKYFKKLLKDPKNEEYKGRIYYELGGFNYKTGDITNAIREYKNSIRENKRDNRLKAYTYLKLADIYYDDLADYNLAKSYYDSTLLNYPKEEEGYLKLQIRADVLTDFVKYYTTIHTNDSLLNLANIPPDSLNLWLDFLVSELEIEAKETADQEKKEKRRAAIISSSKSNTEELLVDIKEASDGTWYFYNTSELSKGFSDFKTKWGQRPLEDNWRRSLKAGGGDANDTEDELVYKNEEKGKMSKKDSEESEAEPTFNTEAEKKKLLATIPFEENDKLNLLQEIEVASYELGKIYNFRLEEKENAIDTFEGFIDRFDSSRYVPEVLYQLFLLYKPIDSIKSNHYFEELTHKHDTSIYAKLAVNPNYLNEQDLANEDYKRIYVRAFDLYESGQPVLSEQLVDSALSFNAHNEYVDNLALLRAMNLGQLEGIYKYQFELNNFIKDYSESELVDYANELLKTSQDFQINLYSSSKAKFIRNFDTKHYFILIYPFNQELTDPVIESMDDFVSEASLKLTTGNIVLDKDYAVVLVNEFDSKNSAQSFLNLFKSKEEISSKFAPARFRPMIITDENFQIFYETKDLDSYITFFQKNYF